MNFKICSKCNSKKEANSKNFYKRNKKGDLRGECKECTKKDHRQYNKDNKKYFKDYHQKWHQENKETISMKNKQWKKDNKESYAEYQYNYNKKRYQEFREQFKIDYSLLHKKIRKIKKISEYCQICNESKELQLSSIDHSYTENPDDYLWLCREDHILFDKCREVISY